jgi:ABC-type branched-subunit amino acid transport system substrate-binding protein
MTAPVRVAILVPQSGPSGAMGVALSQAAQLAVFDLNENNFQLIPKDTGGTPDGARAAVQAAAADGVKLILGPLFAQEVAAAKDAARAYNLPVIEFSTDWRLAGDTVYSMGVLPFGQAQRVASYAAAQGLRRIGIIATGDVYGDAVANEFQSAAQQLGMSVVKVTRLSADGTDAPQAAQEMTGGQALSAERMPYDALFMPVGGSALHTLVASLKSYGITSSNVRFLGTGLWDDASVMRDPAMAGAVYAAPSPQLRTNFERNYQRIYGSMPPRLASIGYDSAALAIVLARNAMAAGRPVDYSRAAITDPNGFSGVDGIFRFNQQGLAERGMAVLQIGGGAVHVVDPAPTTFQ